MTQWKGAVGEKWARKRTDHHHQTPKGILGTVAAAGSCPGSCALLGIRDRGPGSSVAPWRELGAADLGWRQPMARVRRLAPGAALPLARDLARLSEKPERAHVLRSSLSSVAPMRDAPSCSTLASLPRECSRPTT